MKWRSNACQSQTSHKSTILISCITFTSFTIRSPMRNHPGWDRNSTRCLMCLTTYYWTRYVFNSIFVDTTHLSQSVWSPGWSTDRPFRHVIPFLPLSPSGRTLQNHDILRSFHQRRWDILLQWEEGLRYCQKPVGTWRRPKTRFLEEMGRNGRTGFGWIFMNTWLLEVREWMGYVSLAWGFGA